MTKWKKLGKNKSTQVMHSNTQNWALVQLVFTDHPWDVSTSWLESNCGIFSLLDMIWKGTHTCLYKVPQLTVHIRTQTKPWSQRNCLKLSKSGLYRGTDPGKRTEFLQHWRFTEACSLLPLNQVSPTLLLESYHPEDFSSSPNQTHLNQLIKVFRATW